MPNTKRLLVRVLICFLVVGVAIFGFKGIAGFLQVKKNYDLVASASSGNAAKVKVLLLQGANPDSKHIEGSSALWWAVGNGSLPTVQILLSHGANPNSRGQYDSVLENALREFASVEGTAKEQTAKAIVRALIASGAKTSLIKDAESLRLLKKAGVGKTIE